MRPMFESATLKLTGWYMLILMATSLMFSVAIYQITIIGAEIRIDHTRTFIEQDIGANTNLYIDWDHLKSGQIKEASLSLFVTLFYVNLTVLVAGGVGSLFLARRTLRPIERAHEAQSRFSSDASHELRTPLSSMRTSIEVALRDNQSTKQSFREVLNSNLEEVEKLSHMSQMLLDLSKLQYNRLEFGPVELKATLNTAIKRLNIPKKRINQDKVSNFIIHGNQVALEELMTILLDNSVKYSPKGSLISIDSKKRTRQIIIQVSNTGQGIPADKLPHIFDRFYRADKSRTGSGGHGLGLSLAKKIVELHHGELSVRSAPEQLTTFKILLPIAGSRWR